MNNGDELKKAARKARYFLAQLTSTRYVLKCFQSGNVIDSCVAHFIDHPEDVRFQGETLERETQKLFQDFGKYFTEYSSDENPGHLFNKSTVLIADSVLQKYLEEIIAVMQPIKEWQVEKWPNSLGGLIAKLFLGDSLLDYDKYPGRFKHVKFLDQLRHVIIHKRGEVDKQFHLNCGIEVDGEVPKDSWPELWGLTTDWSYPFFKDNKEEFQEYFKIGEQISLPIDKVFGLLKECFIFVNEVLKICLRELT
jgi:hypothetical protein